MQGYQFATWQYTYDKLSVNLGHYYPTWSQEYGTNAYEKAKHDFALRSGLIDSPRHFSDDQLKNIYEILAIGTRIGLLPSQEDDVKQIMEQIENTLGSGLGKPAQSTPFKDLINACIDRVRLAPREYPVRDYPWGIQKVSSMFELMEKLGYDNYSVRTGFVLDNLAFVEQVSGGNEWLALKLDGGEWKSFESISYQIMLHKHGANYCKDYLEHLLETSWHDLKYPSPAEEPTMQM